MLLAGGLALTLGACVSPPSLAPARSFKVGGPCRYDIAMGVARILEVRPGAGAVEMDLGLSMPASFKPAAGWRERAWRVSVLGPPGVPDGRWLVTHGMIAGISYPVELSVIREGTCTPVVLRFPGRPWVVE